MEKKISEKVRIDKLLWAIRIFKTRTLATDACKTGKVKIGENNAKPAQMVGRGDILQVKKEGVNLSLRIIDILETRVGATIAQKCYEDITPEEEKNKFKSWFLEGAEFREQGSGRPTKKERRDIDKFKTPEEAWENWEEWD